MKGGEDSAATEAGDAPPQSYFEGSGSPARTTTLAPGDGFFSLIAATARTSPKRRKLFEGSDEMPSSSPSPPLPLSPPPPPPPPPRPQYASHGLSQHPTQWHLAAVKTEGLFDEIKRLTEEQPARAAITENGSGNSVKLMVEGMWNLPSPEKQLLELEKRAQEQQKQHQHQHQQQSQAALPMLIMG